MEHASLDDAVQALKGAARGIVKIGVSKPLPVPDNSSSADGNDTTTDNTASTAGTTPNEKDEEDRTEVEGSSDPDRDRAGQLGGEENKIPELPDDDEIPPPLPTR